MRVWTRRLSSWLLFQQYSYCRALSSCSSSLSPWRAPKWSEKQYQSVLKSNMENGVSTKIRVAVYGGAYDPPTVDHMRLAAQILRSDEVDEVWLTPCGPRPDKTIETATHDRWAMCHVAVNSFFPPELPVKVCAVDVHRSQAMFTYDLLRKLSHDYPDHEFSFVIGTDWLQSGTDLRSWESEEGVSGHKLIQEFDFIVLRRPGYDVQGELTQFGPRLKWLNVDSGYELIEGNGSSTAVRNRLRSTKDVYSVAGLVPSGVLGYIRRENLYVNDHTP